MRKYRSHACDNKRLILYHALMSWPFSLLPTKTSLRVQCVWIIYVWPTRDAPLIKSNSCKRTKDDTKATKHPHYQCPISPHTLAQHSSSQGINFIHNIQSKNKWVYKWGAHVQTQKESPAGKWNPTHHHLEVPKNMTCPNMNRARVLTVHLNASIYYNILWCIQWVVSMVMINTVVKPLYNFMR